MLRFDVHGADQSAVLAGVEVGAGADVGVIEAQAGGPGHKRDAAAAVRRDEGRALFRGAIDIGGDELAVPMELLGPVGFVVDVDGDALAFFEAQERPGKLAVVGGRGDDAVGREFDRSRGNGKGVVGGSVGLIDDAGEWRGARDCSG